MKVEDVRDMFAFLRTLPPVKGKVRDHDVQFPFNIRRLLGGWKFLFLDGKSFTPDPAQSAQWNRGAYLVNGPAHCAECHSPRNFFWALKNSQRFAGGPSIEGRGWIPNITQARLASWSEQDIAFLLQSGRTPSGDEVGGTMRAIVDRLRRISGDDRMAIAAYVKSLRPVEGPPRPDAK